MPTEPAYTEARSTGRTAGRLCVMLLKDAVVFPRMVVPLMVGRPASLAAVEESLANDEPVFLVTQRSAEEEQPTPDSLYRVGVAATILQSSRLPDGTIKIVVEGLSRGRVQRYYLDEPVPEALIKRIDPPAVMPSNAAPLMRAALRQFEDFARVSQRVAPEIVSSFRSVEDPDALGDMIAAYLPVRVEERQQLLEVLDPGERLERIAELLLRENEMFEMERVVRERVREQMERGQREHFLQEQLKAIHQELGEARGDGGDEFAELRKLIAKAKMPKEVHEKADREMGRYERMPPMSPESAVIRTYLEWLCDIPWRKRTRDSIDVDAARAQLDRDHYGLDKVKERIVEFLAVRKLARQARGPILCLVGPPGVGKTSLGESIARAMHRKFVRISLGGVRDEAEIRGHRRTYIGALPGRIVQSLKKAGVRNPVFMLDEVDKMSADFRGDPTAALLEVLDPAQNKAFSDHYLEVDVDLSEVFFITTANNAWDIPDALRDRLEIVRMAGYTHLEKQRIAEGFLVPRQRSANGLTAEHIAFEAAAIQEIITRYTREAGVRELERQIATTCRKIARRVASTHEPSGQTVITPERVGELLGAAPYTALRADIDLEPGVAVGLAWTETGGDILHIETSITPGKGHVVMTGRLGNVMKESAQTALSLLRARATALGLKPEVFHKHDVHLHLPEGAIPKDGPSAGVAMAISMLSAFKNHAANSGIALTGEVTLRGRVLAVGGVKEKILAAHRAGLRRVILPRENEKDLADIPEEVRSEMTFTLVSNFDEVLPLVLPEKARRKAPARRTAAKTSTAKTSSSKTSGSKSPSSKEPVARKSPANKGAAKRKPAPAARRKAAPTDRSTRR